jgi:hypothetical protein
MRTIGLLNWLRNSPIGVTCSLDLMQFGPTLSKISCAAVCLRPLVDEFNFPDTSSGGIDQNENVATELLLNLGAR